jgi:hypothetical protein
MPALGLVFSKTWNAVYAQIAANEGFGVSSYRGQDTLFNTYGKLGYQFAISANTALTPYAILGYHRSLLNISGTASNVGAINNIQTTYYIDGVTETYQHGWYGAELFMQWAVSPRLVINADANIEGD